MNLVPAEAEKNTRNAVEKQYEIFIFQEKNPPDRLIEKEGFLCFSF